MTRVCRWRSRSMQQVPHVFDPDERNTRRAWPITAVTRHGLSLTDGDWNVVSFTDADKCLKGCHVDLSWAATALMEWANV